MKRRYRCALLAIFLVASGAALLYDQFGFVWVAVAEDWTPEQMLQWFASYQEPSQCALSYDIGGVLNRGPTLTFLDGQKTVCVDPPQLAPTPGNCLVYSFGSNGEWFVCVSFQLNTISSSFAHPSERFTLVRIREDTEFEKKTMMVNNSRSSSNQPNRSHEYLVKLNQKFRKEQHSKYSC